MVVYFSQAILYVLDVHRSMEFYKNAFGLDEKFITETGNYAEIESQTVSLAFARRKFVRTHIEFNYQETTLEDEPLPCEIAFIVDNVDQVYASALKAGATTVAKPVVKPWGQRVAHVRDLDGFLIEIAEKMSVDTQGLQGL